MKCPTCGALWFDSDEDYSLDNCERCVRDAKPGHTTTQRALMYLFSHAGHDGVSCFDVGGAVWPDRPVRSGRGVSSNGGGDYAAQMLLGRLKKAGLVETARSVGSSRWRLTPKGLRFIHEMNSL